MKRRSLRGLSGGTMLAEIRETLLSPNPSVDGAVSAVVLASSARWFFPAGSLLSRHAGLAGGLAGAIVLHLVKRGGTQALVSSALTGLTLELFEFVTRKRVERL